jgi:hypothetical protein
MAFVAAIDSLPGKPSAGGAFFSRDAGSRASFASPRRTARSDTGQCPIRLRVKFHHSGGIAPPPTSMLTMKTRSTVPVVTLTLSAALLSFTACTREDRADAGAAVKEAAADTRDAMSNAWQDVKSYSYDKRDQFTANAKALSSRMDAQLSELRADYSDAKASASRKAAMAELKNSEADYKEKVAALGNASADTWDSAKQNVIAAWDRLQASYYKARAD